MRRPVKKFYDEAASEGLFEPADLLLCRGTNAASRGIRIASLSPFSHAGMLAKRDGEWVILDVVQWKGFRNYSLQLEVNENPGAYDLYKIDHARFPEYDRAAAVKRMWKFEGVSYGWGRLFIASLAYLPFIRLLQKMDRLAIDDDATLAPNGSATPPFCSMARAMADEAGGVDPVNNLRHSMTTPGHLAQSKLYKYACTLYPNPQP